MSDRAYLLNEQYKDSSNLNARIQLHELFSSNKQGVHSWLFDHYDLPPQARVLELGCGPATLWVKNLGRIPDEWDITLSDFSAGMLEDARRNLGKHRQRFKFEVVDAQSIPFDDESFDAVIANFMLYHVPDRPKAFAEIHRVLRPGGRFYAATLGKDHLRELDDMVSRLTGSERRMGGSAVLGFLLENGAEQMAPWFPDVRLHRYEDALVITEAEPLIAYILSMSVGPDLDTDKLASFVRQELARGGAIHVTKDSGMFEGVRDGI
jgi:SAM-dependent methyltransferase